ncbi:MAG: MBL fold metallo-hydrolase [Pseudomonadota bacterium]
MKGGPAVRPGSNRPTSILVRMAGQTILVDAGLGAAMGVCDQGIALTEIDLIIVTHLHSDHYLELGPLLHTAWTCGLAKPLPVIGPPGLEAYWRHFLDAMAFDVDLRQRDEGRPPLAPLAAIEELTDGFETVLGDVRIAALRNDHPPIEDSFALRLIAGETAVVLSGDTAPLPAMEAFARGADLLVHEAMLVDGVAATIARIPDPDPRLEQHILRSHTPAAEVGRLAQAAGVKALALNHFVPDGLPGFGEDDWAREVRKHWDGPLHLGRDGMRIALPG